MILMAIALMSANAAADRDISFIDGQCIYPAPMPGAGPNETRVACDAAVIAPGRDGAIMVQFTTKGSSRAAVTGFAGTVDENGDLEVQRIYLSPGVPTSATGGHCRLFETGTRLTGVSCVGRVGDRAYVANFEASRRQPRP